MDRMAADHAWSRLKPSRARFVDEGGRSDQQHQAGSGSLRGTAWTPSWAASSTASDELWTSSWSGAAPVHGPPIGLPGSALARWKRLAPEVGRCSGAGHGIPGLQQQQPHREGWTGSLTSSLRWGTDRRHYHFDSTPCSETKLDEEMTMFESQITRTVSDHLSNLTSLTSTLSKKYSSSWEKESTPVAASSVEKKSSQGTSSELLKRKRSGLSESDDVQSDCGWIHPLKLVVCKGLTLSDVGELGRIVIPKKDAESQSFPQIDTKEGIVLEMEDYSASKRWYFRFKYWINNKSRMYLLENTGEFIKYHSLTEHDLFVVYEDGCKNLVVCGQKQRSKDKLDPLLDLSKGSAPETTPTSAIEDGSSSRTVPPTSTILQPVQAEEPYSIAVIDE